MDFLTLALIVTGVVAAVAILVVGLPLLTGGQRPRCSRCGEVLTAPDERCRVCQTPFDPPTGPVGADANPTQARTIQVRESVPDPSGGKGSLNPGITHGMVRWALIIMFTGLGIRVLGMLEPVGLTLPIPETLMTALTVLGGIAAFVGFVVLDIA